jgi:hypothetical protein
MSFHNFYKKNVSAVVNRYNDLSIFIMFHTFHIQEFLSLLMAEISKLTERTVV